jgi:hypothetical protein
MNAADEIMALAAAKDGKEVALGFSAWLRITREAVAQARALGLDYVSAAGSLADRLSEAGASDDYTSAGVAMFAWVWFGEDRK